MKIKLDGRRRVTIPTLFADELGIKEKDIINIELSGDKIVISKADNFDAKGYIKALLQEDISFETESYLKDILKKF